MYLKIIVILPQSQYHLPAYLKGEESKEAEISELAPLWPETSDWSSEPQLFDLSIGDNNT